MVISANKKLGYLEQGIVELEGKFLKRVEDCQKAEGIECGHLARAYMLLGLHELGKLFDGAKDVESGEVLNDLLQVSGLDRSWQRPTGVKAKLIDSKASKGIRHNINFGDLNILYRISMDYGDKIWVNLLRWTNEYIGGVNNFLDKAFERAAQGNEILCPCKKCINLYWHYRNVVEDHLVVHGFVDGYTKWVFHGEDFSSRNTPSPRNDDEGSNMRDDIDGMLHDTFRNIEGQAGDEDRAGERQSEEARKFFKLLEEGKQELYPGCENFSKLSFTIRLYLLKSLHGLSNVAFSDLLELIKEAFPFAQVPESLNKAKNMIKYLGLHYEKIYACPNDCMLFWKENEKADNCSICGSSRWKNAGPLTNASSKISTKILRYFPLKPSLQRIFMCPETAVMMRWHANERLNDGNITHPADGEAWKDFDSLHPYFSSDPRNVRKGLSSDGPLSTGNDIDVYLQPLIKELKELWEMGIDTFDADGALRGNWHAPLAIMTHALNISNIVSRCVTWDKKSFDGKEEHRLAPTPLTGEEVFEELIEFNNIFGKWRL
ncbi:uncharacterized protein LOC142162131 [Nicotiana tabacum]|uniref:Uncharacterized protein LOC142162131 n=1 Tax=Nicotiana tabacum TaxID=4097 RepID=A0AC58RPB2_TOBAC